MRFTLSLVLLAVASLSVSAAKSKYIISAEELMKMEPKPVLLHIGTGYSEQHIYGAQNISTRDISTTRKENPLILELPPIERLKETFQNFGVSDDRKVVLYWGKDWVTPTTRVFFTLDYLGLSKNVSILDGGLPAWIEAGGKTVSGIHITKPSKGKITIRRNDLVSSMDEIVEAVLNDKPLQVIDARAKKYYDGDPGSFKRGGHIPKATNIPYSKFVDKQNRFKTKKEFEEIFSEAGISRKSRVVTYCHIGQQASLVYFAAKIAGYDVRVYDGSWNEWSGSKNRVEGNTKKKKP